MVLAHAFGQRYDLPIPLFMFIGGGAAVVLLSFLITAPTPVRPAKRPRPGTEDTGSAHHPAGGLMGMVALALPVTCGLVGSQAAAENLLPTAFWLLTWIVVPLTCAIAGDWANVFNPFAYLAGLADRPGLRRLLLGDERPLRWRFGWWPAVLLYFLTASGELIFNLWATVPGHIALCLIVYALISTTAGLLFGDTWPARGELFSVLFRTWGRLGWFRFNAPGRRGFAGGLDDGFDPGVSRTAFVLLLLVSVNLDGLLATPSWTRLENRIPGALTVHSGRLESFRILVFLALVLAAAGLFAAFAAGAVRAGRGTAGPQDALNGLLPSLIPIAFGYLLAHNLQYVLATGQLMAPLIGNPVGEDWWKIHLPHPFTDSFEPNPHLLPSAFYWYLSVIVIIAVHVVAVVLAHRRLTRHDTSPRSVRAGEYPWLVAMVAYTMLSLWLIAQPLVKEHTPAGHQTPAVSAPNTHV